MDEDLIKEILEYVERVEEQIDNEWGMGRDFDELLQHHKEYGDSIPDFYFKLKNMIS